MLKLVTLPLSSPHFYCILFCLQHSNSAVFGYSACHLDKVHCLSTIVSSDQSLWRLMNKNRSSSMAQKVFFVHMNQPSFRRDSTALKVE